MIPCIENKCLLYPVCRNKRDIICDEVRTFYYREVAKKGLKTSMEWMPDHPVWTKVKKHLPNMSSLKGKVLL